MRKYFAWFFLLAVTIAVGVAAKALAGTEQRGVLRVGNQGLPLNGGLLKTMPKTTLLLVPVQVGAHIAVVAGSQPPAIRESVLNTRRTGFIDRRGVPNCPQVRIEAAATTGPARDCPGAIVSNGKPGWGWPFSNQRPSLRLERW
jgi:hypothetical protein